MSYFRSCHRAPASETVSLSQVPFLLADVLAPRHFFVGPTIQLEWEHRDAEESAWEIFQSRLLDVAQTRQRAVFEAWNVYLVEHGVRSGEPLLSLKFDSGAGQVHVVRGLECLVWEAYDSGDNVILSRQRRKWVRELVNTLHLERFADLNALRDELICSLFHAVIGTSRLPLSSVEAPLPLFSFGELFYCYRAAPLPAGRWRGWQGLLQAAPLDELGPAEKPRWLEAVVRALPWPQFPPALDALRLQLPLLSPPGAPLLRSFLTLFNEVSLSPYHDFGPRILCVLDDLAGHDAITVPQYLDFLATLLIRLGKHLTAYDLITFHHRGANYPDALLLDTCLQRYLGLLECHSELLAGPSPEAQRRRCALRQAWLIRRFYEGHLVPDAPTSPGENNRILPGGRPRVPDEQIMQTSSRRRKLYDGDPLPNYLGAAGLQLLRESVRDLASWEQLREMGVGLFLDRPLGEAKARAEPDRTVLLTSLAYSASLARQRLQLLKREALLDSESGVLDNCLASLEAGGGPKGLPVQQIGPSRRPGVVNLADARRAAGDFIFLHTLPGSLAELLKAFDLQRLSSRRSILLARSPLGDTMLLYDEDYQPRVEFQVDASAGYAVRANKEYPAAGLLARSLEDSAEPVRLLWEQGLGQDASS